MAPGTFGPPERESRIGRLRQTRNQAPGGPEPGLSTICEIGKCSLSVSEAPVGATSNREREQGTQGHRKALDDLHEHLLPTCRRATASARLHSSPVAAFAPPKRVGDGLNMGVTRRADKTLEWPTVFAVPRPSST